MPVLIVGASRSVGRELARLLLDEGAQCRIYVEDDEPELRAAGCKVAVGTFDDLGRLESAMEQVHTVVMLAGGPQPPPGRDVAWWNVELTDIAVRAAVSADVVRFLTVSELGASPEDANPYLRARAAADALVTGSGLQHAILRCAPILAADEPLGALIVRARTERSVIAPGDGTQKMNPIATRDVAGALLRADARDADVRGAWELGGPETVPLASLLAGVRKVGYKRNVRGLTREVSELYARDRVADASAFLALFPMPLTPLAEALAVLG